MKTIFIDPSIKNILKINKSTNLLQSNVKIPVPSGSELLIKTIACGVCSTDISKILNPQKMIKQNKILNRKLGKTYLGHEVVGKVVASGLKKNNSMIGKMIIIGDMNTCKSFSIVPECYQCQKNRGVLCTQRKKRKFNKESYAGFSDYFIRSIHQCVTLPSHINPIKAVFIEPLSTAIHCASFFKKNDSIIINGLTTISVLLYRVLVNQGYKKKLIFINVLNKNQKKQATVFGFINVIINFSKKDINLGKKNIDLFFKKPVGGFSISVDFSGRQKNILDLIDHLQPSSTILLFGMHDDFLNLNFHEFINKEILIRGVHGYSSQLINGKYKSDLVIAKNLISKNKINVLALVHCRRKFSEAYNVLEEIIDIIKIKKKISKKSEQSCI